MSIVEFFVLLLVAGFCGALGQGISGYSRGGCLISIAIGFIGALVGIWLKGVLGLPELLELQFGETRFPIVWAILGSALFVAVINFLTRRRPS